MGLQKEKSGSKIFQIGLWQENKGGKYSQFSSSLFLPFVICYGREIPLSWLEGRPRWERALLQGWHIFLEICKSIVRLHSPEDISLKSETLKSHKFVLWCKFGQKVGRRQRKGLMSSRTESQPTGSCSRKTEKQKSKQATTAAAFRNCEYFCERLSGHSNFNHQSDTDVKSRWA